MARQPQPAFVSPRQAAQILGVPYRTVLRAIRTGDLPVIKLGQRFQIPKSALVAKPLNVEQAS